MLPVEMLLNAMQWLGSNTKGVWLPFGASLLALIPFIQNQELSPPVSLQLTCILPQMGHTVASLWGSMAGEVLTKECITFRKLSSPRFLASGGGGAHAGWLCSLKAWVGILALPPWPAKLRHLIASVP